MNSVDSPGVPSSANSRELFRGFSFVAPQLMEKISINDNNYSTSDICINTTGWARSISDFKFMEQIGRGGFSYCHRCIHLDTGKQYAVKVKLLIINIYVRINF